MIIVIVLMCIALILLGKWVDDKFYDAGLAADICAMAGIGGLIISILTLVTLLVSVSNLKVIDQKIEMYQTENIHIENQIAECVEQYQKYESDIIMSVTSDNAINLVTLYPDLEADKLISKQIDVYISNNEKIKELKEQKLYGDVVCWWLYFGKYNVNG